MTGHASRPWTTVTPKEAEFGGDLGESLDRAIADKRIWNLHGLVVAHRGRLVFERYIPGEDSAWGQRLGQVNFGAETLHDLRSVTKSIVALLYGVALAAGKVPPLDAPLADAFPQYRDLFADRLRSSWRVRHVLTMTMGSDWDETNVPYTDPANSEIAMEMAPDRYRFVLGRPVVMGPGTTWSYSGGATALLGRLIARGTGRPLHEYARDALFDPIGVGPTTWAKGRDGVESAASGLRMTPRDLVRIGQLMLDGGVAGAQVVPAEWLVQCTSPALQIDEVRQFGLHWYMGHVSFVTPGRPSWARNRLERYWGCFGNGGQRLFVLPGLDLVVAITAGNYDTSDQWIPPIRALREVVLGNLA